MRFNNIYDAIVAVLAIVIAISIIACQDLTNETDKDISIIEKFPDVLDIKNEPKGEIDNSVYCFSDQGAWMGFCLPDTQQTASIFNGPLNITSNKWISKALINLELTDQAQKLITPQSKHSTFFPGKLQTIINYDNVDITSTLIFPNSNQAIVKIAFKSAKNITLSPRLFGNLISESNTITSSNNEIIISDENNNHFYLSISNFDPTNLLIDDEGYHYQLKDIQVNKSTELFVLISHYDKRSYFSPDKYLAIDDDLDSHFGNNTKRWETYLNSALKTNASWKDNVEYQRIAVKSVITLINNWKSRYGDIIHDGVFPSYAVHYFHGMWAWDSWKHAIALSKFAPNLAKDQIRCMYDYQNESGMIADCIYANKAENNWLNTKPPLSGWAIWEVFNQTQDTAFVKEMLPKLMKYHEWWYQYRDANKNKLCEYGSSDGSLVAAKWESGMDNAIRFDKSKIIRIDDSNYAFNQESVDLNSYLFFEKIYIAELANVLGDVKTVIQFRKDATSLKELIENKMFFEETGFYHDIDIRSGKPVKTIGPEGWIPLFTNLSSPENADSVMKIMRDSTKFNTYIPFPTAAYDDPEFSTKYWRGPIWLDQVYFAIKSIENYSDGEDVEKLCLRVFDGLEGLKGDAPIRENYWPEDGKGMRVNHFSWSAAHLLMLYSIDS